jgi:hypothetical protein
MSGRRHERLQRRTRLGVVCTGYHQYLAVARSSLFGRLHGRQVRWPFPRARTSSQPCVGEHRCKSSVNAASSSRNCPRCRRLDRAPASPGLRVRCARRVRGTGIGR